MMHQNDPMCNQSNTNEEEIPHGGEPSEDQSDNGSMEEAFNEEVIKNMNNFTEGEIVDGTVVAVKPDSVFVDIGFKSEGEIPKKEFETEPSCGDNIKVMIMKMEARDGKMVLSKQKADEIIKWEHIQKSYRQGLAVQGKIEETTKGGFIVDVESFKAFLPLSQTSTKRVEDPKTYLDKNMLFKIERVEGKSNIVMSRKKYLEEEREKKIQEFFSTKKQGDIIEGTVKDIVRYGAFVNLGGLDGLLHANDISWSKVTDPKKYLNKGQNIRCKILSMDPDERKVSLGLKQMSSDPWESFEERYEKGKKYQGTVTTLTNFGAFVELEEGIEGLLHISELSWTKKIKHPGEVLKEGETVEVMILDYDLNKKTLSLGLKQVLPNPWDDIDVRYPVGSRIKAKVVSTTRFGVFMEIEEGIEGLLRSEDISWTRNTKNPSDILKKGKSYDVMVLSMDKQNKKIRLGMKQLKENPWEKLKVKHPRGSVVSGTVTSIADFGVFLKVDEDIEGLVHISQLSNEKVDHPGDLYKKGDEVKAIVLDIDEEKKKVTLSVKEYLNHLEKKEITKYMEDENTKTDSVKLGDLIDLPGIEK